MKTTTLAALPVHPTARHPLTGQPLRAVYIDKYGAPRWPVLGAAPDDPPADPPKDPPSDPKDPPADPPKEPEYKPPATQADLDRIVGDRVARERAKYSDYAELKRKAEAHDKALEEAQTEQERAVSEARKEGEKSAREKSDTRLVTAEARALAAEAKFRNPGIAVRTIDLSDVTVNDDGEVDAEAVKAKLKQLADDEPYMIDDGKPSPKLKPDPSQGPHGEDDKPSVSRGREMWESRRGKAKAS